jgi:hypothetical protein
MQRGSLVTVANDLDVVADAEEIRPPPSPAKTDAVVFERFNLHANVRIAAEDDTGRERLCRYISRPPFALGRFRRLRDGNIAYRVKKVSRHHATVRVMEPVECLARLASLVAPPRYPLLRLHGVFGARHRWRARIVPKPPRATKPSAPCHAQAADPSTPNRASETAAANGVERPRGDGQAALVLRVEHALPTSSLLASGRADLVAPNVLSLSHWERLEHGALYATSCRIDWRSLLRRTFQVDLRICGRCGGRLSVQALVTDPDDIHRVLAPLQRARDPTAVA